MTDSTLDPVIARACDEAAQWLAMAAASARMLGLTLPQGIAAMMPRVFTGYMPEAQRRAVSHRLISEGNRRPPVRETAADRAKAEAARWFDDVRGAA